MQLCLFDVKMNTFALFMSAHLFVQLQPITKDEEWSGSDGMAMERMGKAAAEWEYKLLFALKA